MPNDTKQGPRPRLGPIASELFENLSEQTSAKLDLEIARLLQKSARCEQLDTQAVKSRQVQVQKAICRAEEERLTITEQDATLT